MRVGRHYISAAKKRLNESSASCCAAPRQRRGAQRGAVLMEYVILLVCFIPVLVGVQSVMDPSGVRYAQAHFNPAGDYTNNFGLVGNAFHDSYSNIVAGVSQPTP